MDIALKFKRAVATLSAGAIFASSAGMALAHEFKDVKYDEWYAPHVTTLVDMGVVDADDYYEPAKSLQRDELAAMVSRMTDCKAGFEAPATPSFTDVPKTSWSFNDIECLAQLGVIGGYEDAQGNKTGKFGPGDEVNRGALVKMITYAFGTPEKLTPATPLSDMKDPSAWWYNPATTAYNWSIIDGKDNGTFDAAANATRAEVAKMLVNALNPKERVPVVVPPGECDPVQDPDCVVVPPATSDGDLEVSLSADTPLSSTVPMKATNVPFTAVDFSADADDVVVTEVKFTRGGVGQREDMEECFLHNDSQRVTAGKTVSSENTLTFPLKNWTIAQGTTGTLTLVCNIADPDVAGPSNQHYFYIASAESIKTNAKSVTGDFPVTGNTFTIGGVNSVVNTALIEAGADPSNVKIGGVDEEVASFRIEAGSENDLGFQWITLNQFGSLSSDKLVNCTLLRGTEEIATAEGFEGDLITFVPETPFVIPEGQSKTFYVHCDIDGGRVDDTIELAVDEASDLGILDMQYGFGADIDNQFTSNEANEVALEGGDLTVVDKGPTVKQISADSTSNEILNFDLIAASDASVRLTQVLVNIEDNAGNKPFFDSGTEPTQNVAFPGTCANGEYDVTVASTLNFTPGDMFHIGNVYARVTQIGANKICAVANGTLTAGTMVEDNVYGEVEDLKIVNLDTDTTVAGPLSFVSGASLCTGLNEPLTICPDELGDEYAKEFTEDYDLMAGEATHLSIQADLSQDIPPGYRIAASVQYPGDQAIKRADSNEYFDEEDVVGAGSTALAGDFMIVAEGNLTVAAATTPSSDEVVKGNKAAPALGISLTAGDGEAVTIKRIDVLAYADDDGTFDNLGEGDLAIKTVASQITLYDGNTIVAGPESIVTVQGKPYGVAQFDALDLDIAAGQTKTLVAKVALLNVAQQTQFLALDVIPSNIIAEDIDGDEVTAVGGTDDHLNFGDTSPNPVLTILEGGGLTASSEGNPDEAIVVAGTKMHLAAKYRFNAVDESFTGTTLTICNDITAPNFCDHAVGTPVVSNVTIKYPNADGVMQTKSVALNQDGTAKFAGLNFFIPSGKDVFLEIYADVAPMTNENYSGKSFRLGLQNVGNALANTQFNGESSANESFEDGDEVTGSALIDKFVVRKTKLKFANVAAGSGLSNAQNTLLSFSVTADAAGSATLARFVADLDLTDTDGMGEFNLDEFQVTRTINNQQTVISDSNIFGVIAGDIGVGGGPLASSDTVTVTFDKEETISAGSTVVYTLKATGVGTETDDTVSTKLAIGDENSEVLVANSVNNNGNLNTARIYCFSSTGGVDNCLLGDHDNNNANDAESQNEFKGLIDNITDRNLIWSDKSDDNHLYPTIVDGVVTNGTGSTDYTNGYLLDIDNLNAHTIEK